MLKGASCYAIYQNKTLDVVNQYFNPYDAAITSGNVSIITPEEARAMQQAEEALKQETEVPEEAFPEIELPEELLPDETDPWEDFWETDDFWSEEDDFWGGDLWTEELPPAEDPPVWEEPPLEEYPVEAPEE